MGSKVFNNSWFLGVKGIMLIILAIYALIDKDPEFSTSLISTTGYILLISGVAMASFGLSNRKIVVIWFYIIEAITDLFFGFVLLVGIGNFENRAFQWLIGVWILTMGFIALLTRMEKTRFLANKTLRTGFWIISVIAGLLFLLKSTSSALPMSVIFGGYLVIIGVYYFIQFMKYSKLT